MGSGPIGGAPCAMRPAGVAICNPAAKLWKKNGNASLNDTSIDDFLPALAGHMKVLLSDADRAAGWTERIEFNTDAPDRRHIEVKSGPVRIREPVDCSGRRVVKIDADGNVIQK